MAYYPTKKGSFKEGVELYKNGLITLDELKSKKFNIGFVHGLSVIAVEKEYTRFVSPKGEKYEFSPYNGLSRL